MTRVLITGGAGFIGSNLAESFVKEGFDVTAVDNFDPYYDLDLKMRNVETCRAAGEDSDGIYRLVKGDILDDDTLSDLTGRDYDYVYHEAAQAGVRTSVEDPMKPNDVNVRGTLRMLNLARDLEVERFVNASSSSVYGKAERLPFDEQHPTTPVSPYGVSKLAAEHYCRVYHEVYGLPTVSLRYFTVYGPRMRPNMAISNFVSRCLNGNPPVIYGTGEQTRDFTHIDDVVDANRTLMDTGAADGDILNIGSTDNVSIRELANVVLQMTDPSLEIVHEDRFKGDAEHTHSDVSRARNLIGYEPSTTIRDGVEKFVDWYRRNRDWYEPLVR